MDRDWPREQEHSVEAEADSDDQGCGFGQLRGGKTAESQKTRRARPAGCDLPQLIEPAVGVGDDTDAIPVPAQSNDLPAHGARGTDVAVLVEERGTSDDAGHPGRQEAELNHLRGARSQVHEPKRSHRPTPSATPPSPVRNLPRSRS